VAAGQNLVDNGSASLGPRVLVDAVIAHRDRSEGRADYPGRSVRDSCA
jgi:hypothetical protein